MLKKTPLDFQVDEVLGGDLKALLRPDGPHALYRLRKESLATPEAVGQIARALKLPARAFAYAGLKDKHAKTSQHVTLKIEELKDQTAPETAKGTGWHLERLGFVPRSITAADIQRNGFRITVRNLTAEACKDMDDAVALLTVPKDGKPCVRFVNYFGDQRFGSARHGQGFIGRHLCKGDFEGALKLAIATESRKDRMDQKVFKRTLLEKWGNWNDLVRTLRPCPERKAIERLSHSSKDFRAAFCALPYLLQQLSVYAYQSHLWNATARRVVERICTPLGQVIVADDVFGEMLFPAVDATPPDLAAIDLPLLARKTELKEPWKQDALEVLESEKLTQDELHIAGVRRPFFGEEPRSLFALAEEFHLSVPEADPLSRDGARKLRAISFTLQRGAYATVVLRALGQ